MSLNQSAGLVGANLVASSKPAVVKNPKRISILDLHSGFLCEMQNVNEYGTVNDVAVDLDGAIKIANDYFAQ